MLLGNGLRGPEMCELELEDGVCCSNGERGCEQCKYGNLPEVPRSQFFLSMAEKA